jgi:hypothetical protein
VGGRGRGLRRRWRWYQRASAPQASPNAALLTRATIDPGRYTRLLPQYLGRLFSLFLFSFPPSFAIAQAECTAYHHVLYVLTTDPMQMQRRHSQTLSPHLHGATDEPSEPSEKSTASTMERYGSPSPHAWRPWRLRNERGTSSRCRAKDRHDAVGVNLDGLE